MLDGSTTRHNNTVFHVASFKCNSPAGAHARQDHLDKGRGRPGSWVLGPGSWGANVGLGIPFMAWRRCGGRGPSITRHGVPLLAVAACLPLYIDADYM